MGRAPQTRTLDVWINGRLAGYYRYSPAGGVSFQYERDWLDWEHAFPLSRQLPLLARSQSGGHVNAVFENLLPDNAEIRRMIAERTEARSERPHDLLAAIGRDCVGAMQFVPHDQDPGDPFVIEGEVQSEAQIAETLRRLARDPLGIAEEGEPLRISLAGAQEKTAYMKQGGDWLKPRGLTPTTHIFKRPIGVTQRGLNLAESVENEYLCLKILQAFGLEANNVEMAQFEDERVLVIERFDRAPRARGGIVRLPQEDFLQAFGFESGLKYQGHGGPSMRDCLALLAASENPLSGQKHFLKAQILNWMLLATDGHAKNYSVFNLPGGGFRMTPLYDVLTAAPAELRNKYRHKDIQMAMSVGNARHYRMDQIHPRHFTQTARAARVPDRVIGDAVAEIAKIGRAAMAEVEGQLPGDFPERISGPVLERLGRCLATVEAYAESDDT